MKVKFYFPNGITGKHPGHGEYASNEIKKIDISLIKKTNKVIDIESLPGFGMSVDLISFTKTFDFSKEETNCMFTCTAIFFVLGLRLHEGFYEIWLDKTMR